MRRFERFGNHDHAPGESLSLLRLGFEKQAIFTQEKRVWFLANTANRAAVRNIARDPLVAVALDLAA